MQGPISAADFSGGRVVSDSDAWLAESGAELEAELQRVQAASTLRGRKSGEREGSRGGTADSQEAQLDQLSSRLQVHESLLFQNLVLRQLAVHACKALDLLEHDVIGLTAQVKQLRTLINML